MTCPTILDCREKKPPEPRPHNMTNLPCSALDSGSLDCAYMEAMGLGEGGIYSMIRPCEVAFGQMKRELRAIVSRLPVHALMF
jgi:hypothetical protein